MRCPFCGYGESKVIDSRDANEAVRRRRECLHCSSRFTTYERFERAALLVVKRDGRREEFDREKLLSGIRKACAKRPVSSETMEQTADAIEVELHHTGRGEIDTTYIGDLVMTRLRQLDGIAYIRFASVYRAFADIEEVKQEADAFARLSVAANDTAQLPLFSGEGLEKPSRGSATGMESKPNRSEEVEREKRAGAPAPR